MLQNRIYRGEIVHKDQTYAGEHEPIIDQSCTGSYLTRLPRLAYLAPDITAAILDGRQPAGVTAMLIEHRTGPSSAAFLASAEPEDHRRQPKLNP